MRTLQATIARFWERLDTDRLEGWDGPVEFDCKKCGYQITRTVEHLMAKHGNVSMRGLVNIEKQRRNCGPNCRMTIKTLDTPKLYR